MVQGGDKVALVDTSHAKFGDLYLAALRGVLDPARIDYLVVSHTEPDHSGLVAPLLALAPNAVVVGSRVCLQFLANLVLTPFKSLEVKAGSVIDLGGGHELEFVPAPNLHWPDTMFSFDRATGVLFTCDAFGAHYCSPAVFDDSLEARDLSLFSLVLSKSAAQLFVAFRAPPPPPFSAFARRWRPTTPSTTSA